MLSAFNIFDGVDEISLIFDICDNCIMQVSHVLACQQLT